MFRSILTLLTLFAAITLNAAEISSPTYSVSKKTDAVVQTALQMWKGDMQQVLGVTPRAAKDANIRIVQLDRDASALKELRNMGMPVDSLIGRNDGFYIKAQPGGKVIIVGNNGRGTAYGILELSRLAGVSPWVWWSNVTPQKKAALTIPDGYETLQVASVEYRGIFINDEDWTLQPWSWQVYEPGAPAGRMGAKTYRRIFELLMRLRANAIWPGMHGISTPFYLVPGAKEQADSCGIAIGTSHCEPLARNNVGEWDEEKRGQYNYVTNGENVRQYWIERLKEAKDVDNIYTIGMRGIHDGPMQGVKTRDEQTTWLQKVIDDQRLLLKKYVGKDVTKIPQQFVPYKEVLGIMENGLNVPEDVMLTWCDDNYGYMTRLSDKEQQKRSGGGGIYYHLSYWGRPLDYMWLCCTQPGLIYNEMKEAYNNNVRRLWIVNVHELKVAAYPLEVFLDMAWDINLTPSPSPRERGAGKGGANAIGPGNLGKHLENWLCREFGKEAGEKLLPAMIEYYRLTGIRKPEFMGWNQVELDKKVVPGGKSPITDTEFSFTAFGNEADRYMSDWQKVCQQIEEAEKMLPSNLKDAFFSHVKYQVLASAAMTTKMLEAQRARSLAAGNYDAKRWKRDEALYRACARSQKAYQEIRTLTDYWNNKMAGGFWKGTMNMMPRDLYMFYPAQLPMALTDKEVEKYANGNGNGNGDEAGQNSYEDGTFVASDACRYTAAGKGVQAVQMLGHSMNAVQLPKGEALSYDFTTSLDGDATLYVALIPTQPNDKGDLRFSVSIDGGEPQVCSLKEKFRSEQWKLNVLRGQALKNFPVTLSKGQHRLEIKALDDHILIDQWMVDFKKDRKFYVIPSK